MPVTIIVGGQFGSEGKGKVALYLVRETRGPKISVRVGGPNSGHIGYGKDSGRHALRQLPAGCIDRSVDVVLPVGSYIDKEVLLNEIQELDYPSRFIHIHPQATIVTDECRQWEKEAGLAQGIGSTGSGTGGAVLAAMGYPDIKHVTAGEDDDLRPYVNHDTDETVYRWLDRGWRVIIEGTQGFGLSVNNELWPKVTSRNTTAAGMLAEANISPFMVDEVIMVIRSFPIRVAGDSGYLPNEISWDEVGVDGEFTTVTNKLRRVGRFDPDIVSKAITANNPTHIVMNHLDYIEPENRSRFVRECERDIGREITFVGLSPYGLTPRADI